VILAYGGGTGIGGLIFALVGLAVGGVWVFFRQRRGKR
jgi:hypothetical protein